ncbi:MAG: FAD synthetase [Sphaerochaetaceae bacterium]|nr:FAD synthetase [Sphaerochaetaceae bacterium]
MKICSFAKEHINEPLVICIGVFDGLHLAHQMIIDETISLAKELCAKSMVISFSTNPKMSFGDKQKILPLQTSKNFTEMLANRGVNYSCVIDFSADMSKLFGEEFIALLCTSYKLKAMVVGNSFRCGHPSHSVGPSQIDKLLSKYTSAAFLKVMPSLLIEQQEVSSSLIRRCLLTGDLEKVSKLLGRAYSLDFDGCSYTAEVNNVSQNRLLYDVRTLGQLLPCEGLYMVEATGEGKSVKASARISDSHLVLDLPVRMQPDGITFLGE